MGHVVNFSPMPSSAIAAQLTGLAVDVVSLQDVEDDLAACTGAIAAVADFSGARKVTAAHAAALAGTCRAVLVPSAGTDSIDVAALQEAGIPVATAGGLNAVTVAEWAVWATIGGLRQLSEQDLGIRSGRWQQFGTRYEVAGKQVLLVGMGPICEHVARRLRPFDATLTYWSRTRRSPAFEDELGLRYRDLDDGLAEADVVILAVALAEGTRGLLDASRLARMKPSATVVNAGRAELVDQDAVLAALDEGRLHGYATDVFLTEPPPSDDPMLTAATIATPHVAGVSLESVGRILGRTIENLNRVLAGQAPLGLLD